MPPARTVLPGTKIQYPIMWLANPQRTVSCIRSIPFRRVETPGNSAIDAPEAKPALRPMDGRFFFGP